MTLPGLPQPHIAKIDCGSCRKCCKGDQLIILTDADDPNRFQCHEIRPGVYAVDRAANGDCIYLGDKGCTIWGRHPEVCRIFDCAAFVKRMDERAFDGVGPRLGGEVVREGRRRLREREKRL
jgi:Fe-S-cluster containining protein